MALLAPRPGKSAVLPGLTGAIAPGRAITGPQASSACLGGFHGPQKGFPPILFYSYFSPSPQALRLRAIFLRTRSQVGVVRKEERQCSSRLVNMG